MNESIVIHTTNLITLYFKGKGYHKSHILTYINLYENNYYIPYTSQILLN